MKTQKLQTTLNKVKVNPEMLEMHLDKIREYIKILENHEQQCEKDQKFSEAASVREKINQLKILEEEKAKDELQKLHQEEIDYIESEKIEDLRNFNEEYDTMYAELSKKLEETQSQLLEQHKVEYQEAQNTIENSLPDRNPKSSPEILDLTKKLEGLVKRKDYKIAHDVQMKINQLTEALHEKWNSDTKQWKIDCEMQRLKTKQDNEFNALKLKVELSLNEFKRKRSNDLENLQQKYKNKLKDLSYAHKNQMNELTSASKSIFIKDDKFLKTNNLIKKNENGLNFTGINMNSKTLCRTLNSKTLK